MSIRRSILIRVRVAFFLMLLGALLILLRILQIQTVEYERWTSKAQENLLSYRKIEANRGNILAADGSLLATSTPFYRLAIDPTTASDEIFKKDIDSLSILVAKYFRERSVSQIKNELKNARTQNRRYVILSRKRFDYQDKKYLMRWPIIREGRRRGGVIFEKIEKRYRPFASLARRTIGFVRAKNDTSSHVTGRGLEYSFHKKLAGQNGEALFRKIAGGHWMPENDGTQIQPQPGLDIQTTIDIDIQQVATQSLKNALVQNEATYGCAIFMEVETGEVKAIVNLGKNRNGTYGENNNYAVGNAGLAEPGSTFKLASMTALLEETNIQLTDTINTGNGRFYFFEDLAMTDARAGGYGRIPIKKVFEYSSNIGISKLVHRYFNSNPERFLTYLDKFHFTKPIEFQMVGEAKPYIKHPTSEHWSGSTLPWMSVGYEMKISPLHTLAFCNALVNKGKMIQPIIVKRAIYANTIIEEYKPKILVEKVASEQTLYTMQKLMEGVVKRGTAKNIYTDEYGIGGKTGTSEKWENNKYTEKHYTSFVGYFPTEKPKYTGIVVVSNTKEGRYGGKVAAPVFREIADYIFKKYLFKPIDNPKDKKIKTPQMRSGHRMDFAAISDKFGFRKESFTPEDWVFGKPKGDTLRLEGNAVNMDLVPNVKGMSLKDALYLLENRGLQVKFVGTGKVIKQSIPIGRKIQEGREIVLTLK